MELEVSREIIELHDFFEDWFIGESIDQAFERVEGALGPGFVLVSPSGDRDERQPLLENIRLGHGGRRETFRIWIEDIQLRHSVNDIHVATYQEIQQERDEHPTVRLSTVVFRESPDAPNGLIWLHVHETWLQ